MQWELHFKDKTYIIHRSKDLLHFTPRYSISQIAVESPPASNPGLCF